MKKLIAGLAGGALIVGFGLVSYLDIDKNVETEVAYEAVQEDDLVIGYYQLGMIDELVDEGGYMIEEDLRQTIHYMSHQKVHADNKFGRKILITKDLVVGLEKMLNNYDYEHEALYREILGEWKEANFDNAVAHHNAIWEIEGGDVGKATRLLTEEEEQAYIQRYEQDNATKYHSKKLEYSFE